MTTRGQLRRFVGGATRRRWGLAVALVLFVFAVLIAALLLSGLVVVGLHLLGLPPFGNPERTDDDFRRPLMVLLMMTLLSVVLGTTLAALLSRFALKPLRQVIGATKRVAEGDFSARVDLTGIAELEQLSTSFNTMASELSSVETLRRDFINDVSHEFRTPIVSLRGYASLLQDPGLTDEEKRDYLGTIIQEADRLTALSGNILRLTTYENTGIITDRAPFRLDEQIRQAVLVLQPKWADKHIRVDVDVDEITYDGNADLTQQIWLNILDNAVKFTDAQGRIDIRGTQTSGTISVVIRDNGIGMSDEVMTHIFDRFYQGDHSRAQTGSGLGLAIVKRIVDLCGGAVTVTSNPGHGSGFTVTLPRT